MRLLDYNEGKAFVIQKTDFDRALLVNDVNVRRETPYLPSPVIREMAEDVPWYSEDLITGTPIHRLKDARKGKEAVKQVTAPLFRLYEKTAQAVNSFDYACEILNRIEERIRRNRHLKKGEREALIKTSHIFVKILGELHNGDDDETFIVQSHGDFQPANILVGDDKAWLIDWEYTARRQAAYDGLVFSLASRFPRGLNKRLNRALDGHIPQCKEVFANHPFVAWHDRTYRLRALVLFLLEELELRLAECSSSQLRTVDRGFRDLWKEIIQASQDLAGV